MARADETPTTWTYYLVTGLWAVAGLAGPVPWVYLATRELERFWGTTGYSIAFVAAPALWTALATAAFLTNRRRWAIALAAIGALLWWTTT